MTSPSHSSALGDRRTIADVARAAGVSKATVSRVLNGSDLVSASTRERVERTIRDLGFATSWQARSLARGRSECIGVIVSEPFEDLWSDPTFTAILQGIWKELDATPYVPLLIQVNGPAQQAKVRHLIDRSFLDAAIHVTPYVDFGLLEALLNSGVPSVLCGQPGKTPWPAEFATVYADDVIGARLAAQLLRDAGRKHPVAILGPEDNPASRDRLSGYAEVFPELTDTPRHRFTGWDFFAGATAADDLLDQVSDVDCILCASDRQAVGALQALARRGLQVPADVSLVGFDDHPFAAEAAVPLTTVAQPMQLEGRTAVELALALISGNAPEHRVLDMTLIQRQSV